MKYFKHNSDSWKFRVVLAVIECDAHNRLVLYKISNNLWKINISQIKDDKIWKIILGWLNYELIKIYAPQQEKLRIDREFDELLTDHRWFNLYKLNNDD